MSHAGRVDHFTGKAARAAFEGEIVEMNQLGFRSRGLRPFDCFFQQRSRIPALSRAAVDGDQFHVEYPPIKNP